MLQQLMARVRNESTPSVSLQLYLMEETVMSYLDVRRGVRDSLKHVYVTERPQSAQSSSEPCREESIIIMIIIVV